MVPVVPVVAAGAAADGRCLTGRVYGELKKKKKLVSRRRESAGERPVAFGEGLLYDDGGMERGGRMRGKSSAPPCPTSCKRGAWTHHSPENPSLLPKLAIERAAVGHKGLTR